MHESLSVTATWQMVTGVMMMLILKVRHQAHKSTSHSAQNASRSCLYIGLQQMIR